MNFLTAVFNEGLRHVTASQTEGETSTDSAPISSDSSSMENTEDDGERSEGDDDVSDPRRAPSLEESTPAQEHSSLQPPSAPTQGTDAHENASPATHARDPEQGATPPPPRSPALGGTYVRDHFPPARAVEERSPAGNDMYGGSRSTSMEYQARCDE